MKFIKLTYAQNKGRIWVNPDRITYMEKFDQARYIHFGSDDYVIVTETLQEIEDLINGQTV